MSLCCSTWPWAPRNGWIVIDFDPTPKSTHSWDSPSWHWHIPDNRVYQHFELPKCSSVSNRGCGLYTPGEWGDSLGTGSRSGPVLPTLSMWLLRGRIPFCGSFDPNGSCLRSYVWVLGWPARSPRHDAPDLWGLVHVTVSTDSPTSSTPRLSILPPPGSGWRVLFGFGSCWREGAQLRWCVMLWRERGRFRFLH